MPTTLQVKPNASPTHPWVIQGLYIDGKRQRRFFKTKAEAEGKKAEFEAKLQNEGTEGLKISQDVRNMAAKWSKELEPFKKTIADASQVFIECTTKLVPYGKTISEAINFYTAHLDQSARSVSFNELSASFTTAKIADGKSKRYLEDIRSRVGRFGKTYGDTKVSVIITPMIDDWLRALELSPKTRNNFRRVLHSIFAYAKKRGYCSANPVAETDKAKEVRKKKVPLFSPAEARALLDAAASDILPALVIGMFAGLRQAEIQRLDWSNINQARKLIEITPEVSKTSQRRLVTIEPNLALWLAPYADRTSGNVMPANHRVKIEAAWKATKLDTAWPTNGLRHSYASYHLAHFTDAARLSLQMGHESTKVLFAHYREVVQPSEAKEFWDITPTAPDNVVQMATAA